MNLSYAADAKPDTISFLQSAFPALRINSPQCRKCTILIVRITAFTLLFLGPLLAGLSSTWIVRRHCTHSIDTLLLTPSFPLHFVTMILRSICSFSSDTWEITPTRRFPSVRRINAFIAWSSYYSSSEQNPSYKKIDSICIPPDCYWF